MDQFDYAIIKTALAAMAGNIYKRAAGEDPVQDLSSAPVKASPTPAAPVTPRPVVPKPVVPTTAKVVPPPVKLPPKPVVPPTAGTPTPAKPVVPAAPAAPTAAPATPKSFLPVMPKFDLSAPAAAPVSAAAARRAAILKGRKAAPATGMALPATRKIESVGKEPRQVSGLGRESMPEIEVEKKRSAEQIQADRGATATNFMEEARAAVKELGLKGAEAKKYLRSAQEVSDSTRAGTAKKKRTEAFRAMREREALQEREAK